MTEKAIRIAAGPLGRAALSSTALAQNTAPARTGGGTAKRVYRLS